MKENVLTLATFPNITEASIIQGKLARAGIESYVVDSNMNFTDSVPGDDFGGVLLNIREEDASKAQEILSSPGLKL